MDSFDTLLNLALSEDLGSERDVTSRALFSGEWGKASLLAKQEGILAGCPYFERTFARVDPQVKVSFRLQDRALLSAGDVVADLEGPLISLMEGERTALNFLSFLSGIATKTQAYTQAVSGGRALILDTRKTLPGYRALSKYAVSVGGAQNHRQGLYDMVMIKDNHIDAVGSLSEALAKVRKKWGRRYRVEVETRTLEEVAQAIEAGADIIMLDNMDEQTCIKAVALAAGRVIFEASGNLNLERVRRFSNIGVDFLSVGALTHSVEAFDFSLRISQ